MEGEGRGSREESGGARGTGAVQRGAGERGALRCRGAECGREPSRAEGPPQPRCAEAQSCPPAAAPLPNKVRGFPGAVPAPRTGEPAASCEGGIARGGGDRWM